jgi:ribosomal protein S18 acetylase RimI-like enzyme
MRAKDNGKAISFYKKFGFSPSGKEQLVKGTRVTEVEYIKEQ